MESIESEKTNYSFSGWEGIDLDARIKAPQQIRAEPWLFDAARIYAKPLGGITASLALLALPALTLPGFAIFVLIGEIYLIDWTYHKFSEARLGGTKLADTESRENDLRPEDEIDKFADRAGSKNQFTR
ncbi:MAG: hypothetical protein ACFFER_07875 [Candidatus Thorarchaeota archaeon]